MKNLHKKSSSTLSPELILKHSLKHSLNLSAKLGPKFGLSAIALGLLASTSALAIQGEITTVNATNISAVQAGNTAQVGNFANQNKAFSGLNHRLPQAKGKSLEDNVAAFINSQPATFKINADKQLKHAKTKQSDKTLTHVSYDQMHGNYKVLGRQMTVHMKNDTVTSVTSNTVGDIQLPKVVKTLSQDRAMQAAKQAFAVDETKLSVQTIEKVVFFDEQTSTSHWAYSVKLGAMGKAMDYVIDATNGKVLRANTRIHRASTTGSGINLQGDTINSLNMYQGTDFTLGKSDLWKSIMGNASKSSYNLVDLTNSQTGHLYTMSLEGNFLSTGANIQFVRSADNSFNSSGNSHPAGTSIHKTLANIVDYYQVKHNLNGIDNNGMDVVAVVNMGDDPSTTNGNEALNAYWDGTNGFMAFGEGAGNYANFAGSIDVAGHELTHAVTNRSSNLVYANQSGALNEAISDMFGYLIERHSNGTANWLVGEDLTPGGLRDMANPGTFNDPDTVGGANYQPPVATPDSSNDQGYVHSNSGIPNKMFYLLVSGGSHNGINVAAMGSTISAAADNAGALMYLANTGGYFTSTTDFAAARTQMLAAVTDLFPGDQAKEDSVKNAWAAVGVGSPASTTGGDTVLENGVAKTSLTAATNAELNFTMEVPAGATGLNFAMSGGTGDADMYVKFGSAPTSRTDADCAPYKTGNTESCPIATAQAGTYYVNIKSYQAFSGLSLTGSYTTGGVSSEPSTYTQGNNVTITDNSTVSSAVEVTRTGDSGSITVDVDIKHTYIGDLIIKLVTPDGQSKTLEDFSNSNSADNVLKTYNVDVSGVESKGSWKLQVSDGASGDSGTIDSFTLNF